MPSKIDIKRGRRKPPIRSGGFQSGSGNWTEYRTQFDLSESDEINLHFGKRDSSSASYQEAMADVRELVAASLEEARREGRPYLMFVHGSSTSRPGRTTARSQVRGFMRSTDATGLIDRRGCIQHETVFVAKLRLS
jgi:hypothetical protein